MKEDVKVFLNQNPNDMPYSMESLGISYCDETYHQIRPCGHVNVFEYVISGKGTVKTAAWHGLQATKSAAEILRRFFIAVYLKTF